MGNSKNEKFSVHMIDYQQRSNITHWEKRLKPTMDILQGLGYKVLNQIIAYEGDDITAKLKNPLHLTFKT